VKRTRAAVVRIVDQSDATTVIGPRSTLRFDGDSAALLRAVLEIHGRAVTRDELFAELAVRSGGDVPAAPVDELVAMLEREGVLIAPPPIAPPPPAVRRVVLAISGAVDAPMLVRGLHALGCDVRVALTKTAQRFVPVAALEALTHHQVWRGLWQRDDRVPVPHVNLAEWAELVVVWPASATTLARIATGDCSDLVSAIATATRAPVVIAPSMNDAMFAAPAVQQNLATLRAHGRWIVHPTLGHEVAHRPEDRRPLFGPAAPPAAMIDIVRHVLGAAPRMPVGAAAWERLWTTTPLAQLPWHADDIEPALAQALDARPHGTLVDLGTGAGTVAIAAARRGFRVTATDIAPTALGRARDRAGDLSILFALDDITQTRLAGPFDIAVDVGLLHCLPRTAWPAYAEAVTRLASSLLLVAHTAASPLATEPISADQLAAALPAFRVIGATPTTLARVDAQLFELARIQ
jgi:uncharacterized UPF0146 family protein